MPNPIAIAAGALIRDGRVLMAHRNSARRWYPDCWDLVGGHIEAGESPEQAVIRECVEELGIRILDPQPLPMAVTDPGIEMHAFLVQRWDGEPVNAAPAEHDQLGWFGPSELARLNLADAAILPVLLRVLRVGQATSIPNPSSAQSSAWVRTAGTEPS